MIYKNCNGNCNGKVTKVPGSREFFFTLLLSAFVVKVPYSRLFGFLFRTGSVLFKEWIEWSLADRRQERKVRPLVGGLGARKRMRVWGSRGVGGRGRVPRITWSGGKLL